jgi:DNA recombination protein Rad52
VLSEELKAMLEAPLTGADVKTRQGKFTYIETWFAKKQANRIFGHDGWGYQVSDLRCVGSDAIEKVDDNGQVTPGWRVGYVATVQVDALMCTRSDVGYGDAVEYGQSSITCHELAAKEAVSDALKRALASYGDQFGLILYDKDREPLEGETGKAAPKRKPKPKERTVVVPPELQTQINEAFDELRRREPTAKAVQMYDKAGGAEEVPYWPLEEAEAALAQAKHIIGILVARAEPELPPDPPPGVPVDDGDDIPF